MATKCVSMKMKGGKHIRRRVKVLSNGKWRFQKGKC